MTRSAQIDIVTRIREQSILVVGDVMLDEYVWGDATRISPEAPVPVVDYVERTYVAGGAANVAVNAASMGNRSKLGGVIGQDVAGDILCATLANLGVESTGLSVDMQRPTTLKMRIIAHRQQIVRLDTENRAPLSSELEDQILHWVELNLSAVGACVISDYAKGVVSDSLSRRVIDSARQAGLPVIIDPKGSDYTKYRGATVITPNLHEVEHVCGRRITSDNELNAAGQDLLGRLPGSAILITRGPGGMVLFRQDCVPMHIPSVAHGVFDVTGAGDTVVSTLSLGLATGAELEDAAVIANTAAGIVVGKMGTATVTIDELLSVL